MKKRTKTCTDCPLHETAKCNNMRGDGVKGGLVFLGEAPGRDEDQKGKPFVGQAGKLLRALVKDHGLTEHAYFTNVNRCWPGKANPTPSIHNIRKCRPKLLHELDRVKPKGIVALGANASKCIMDNAHAKITQLRGTTTTWNGYPVFFTNHPSAVQYDRGVMDYLEGDFKTIRQWFRKGCITPKAETGYRIRPWEKLKESVDSLEVAFDIETNSLDPYSDNARVMCMSVAPTGREVYYKSFGKKGAHPKSEEVQDSFQLLRKFLVIVCHSTPFDLGFMTVGCLPGHWIWSHQWRDTLLDIQFFDENYKNTSLGHLSWIFARTKKLNRPDCVKEGFPKGWATTDQVRKLRRYNCQDSIATIRLHHALRPKEDSQEYPAYKWASEHLKTVVRMRHAGIRLDLDRVSVLHADLTKKKKFHERKLARTVLVWDKKDKKFKLNQAKLSEHLYEKLRLPVLKRTPTTKKPSTDKQTLEQLKKKDGSGFVKSLLRYREVSKLRDTYCVNMLKWGEVAHPRVWLSQSDTDEGDYGTNTSRLTVEQFINLPSKTDLIQRCVITRYRKGVIVCWDYSQMELRILADLSKDERMLDAFFNDEDLHTRTAAEVFGVKLKNVTKEQRFKAKTTNFGVIYGQTAKGLARTLETSLHEASAFIERYFNTFTGVRDWIEEQHRKAMNERIVHSPIGWPFHLPNAINRFSKDLRKAVNSPIQGPAANFNTEAVRQVQLETLRQGWSTHVFLAVYDSGESDWKKKEWKQVTRDLMDELLIARPKQEMSKLGWDIEVPIKYDLHVGPSWGECKEMKW